MLLTYEMERAVNSMMETNKSMLSEVNRVRFCSLFLSLTFRRSRENTQVIYT